MAHTTTPPPQAYTRDTLVKAIEWLSSQSQVVREKATSADLIVSLYLQAKRRSLSEAPVSEEHFKADLKTLAEDLRQFEDMPLAPPQPGPSRPMSYALPPPPTPPTHGITHSAPSTAPTWVVDSRSLLAAREIQKRLNLSNEFEALRFLITLGSERAKEMFP